MSDAKERKDHVASRVLNTKLTILIILALLIFLGVAFQVWMLLH